MGLDCKPPHSLQEYNYNASRPSGRMGSNSRRPQAATKSLDVLQCINPYIRVPQVVSIEIITRMSVHTLYTY